jgi:ubiquinone/menaquinone biosynthesis C-methylase UbiE
MSLADAWESHASEWIVWARASEFDGFWTGTWPELQKVLPPPEGLTVDLGCGEGRGARKLAEAGHRVVGFERSPTLAAAAGSAVPPVAVAQADATALPLPDGCARLVVASMVLQDLDDLDSAINEVARVLADRGRFCFAIVHPFDSAHEYDPVGTGPGPITTPYLTDRRYADRIERDGISMTFESAHHPLSRYAAALERAGFVIAALREFGDNLFPWLLVCRAVKVALDERPL